MKKVIFTLLIQILVTMSIAKAQGSVLNLNMNGNNLFTVQMDNQYINTPDNRFTLLNLAPGSHYIRIYKLRQAYGAREVFSGYVNIPFNSEVNAVYERSGRLKITNIVAMNIPAPCNYNPQVVTCHNTNDITPLCDSEFNHILSTLNNITFDSSRLNVAKQIIADKYLSTTQVVRIMELFTFDSSRLEFAKYAYGRTVDKNRYFETYNSFTFDSSVNELSQYIARYS